MANKMNRREFMVQTTSAVIGAGLASQSLLRGGQEPVKTSRVVEVFHRGCVGEGRRIDPEAVKQMLRTGMRSLAGAESPWSKFIKPADRVGLKINCLGKPLLYTHRELVQAVINELLAIGVPENNIVVWDRWQQHMTASRFILNTTDTGVRCYGTEGYSRTERRIDPDVSFVSELDTAAERWDGRTASYFSSIFTKECDKIINMAVLKDHNSSGYTMCLKNLAFGLCDNNDRFHLPPYIDPFIVGVCAMPIVREKTVLHMIDGIEACYDQGPDPSNPRVIWAPQTLWLGTDPVALDTVGWKVIDEKRVAMGLPKLKDTPSYSGPPRPVGQVALAAAKGLGICDPDRIKIDRQEL